MIPDHSRIDLKLHVLQKGEQKQNLWQVVFLMDGIRIRIVAFYATLFRFYPENFGGPRAAM